MRLENRDCVVLGGGPAGSTFAAVAKKYAPDLAITLLEKDHFPRYHIGESLIPAANVVLRDLELEDRVHSTFVKKMGITFIWGKDRTPWDADYLRIGDLPPVPEGRHVINVLGQDFTRLLRRPAVQDTTYNAVNVRRAEFDKMLLDQARAFGVDVREGTRAVRVQKDDRGAVEAVEWEDETGARGAIMTPFVLDATGLSAMLTRGQRAFDPAMNNFAVYGYLKNARWKVMYSGTKERTNVFIASVAKGWIWYIPVGEDLMSVGAVTNTAHFRDRLKSVDLEELFWEMLHDCPEIRELVKFAYLATDFLPNGARVACSQDWSSWATEPIGDGWAAVGDAAIFVDPILSSGVTLALQSAHRAAYTFNTLRKHPEIPGRSLWRAHADYTRGEAGAFLRLARCFYGHNRAAESWWWEAQRLVNASGTLKIEDRQAFTMATAGFFPSLKAIGQGTVAPLVEATLGLEGDLLNIFHEDGIPPASDLQGYAMETLTPFRLDLRTEPAAEDGRPTGDLLIYHDLVPDNFDFAHRTSAIPSKIAPAMAPVVSAIPRHRTVSALLDEAPDLLPAGFAPREDIKRSTLGIVRIAALKGFVRLHPAS